MVRSVVLVQVRGAEVQPGADSARFHLGHEVVAVDTRALRIDAHDEQMPRVPERVVRHAQRQHAVDGLEQIEVAFGQGSSLRIHLIETRELADAERGVHVRQVVLEARLDDFGLRRAALRLATYTLGGEGFWDYIVPDAGSHRLFIGRQNRLMVVDANDGKLLGEVVGIEGAHGTAIAPETGHGFATAGDDESVVMFDLKTLEELRRIPAGEDADAIIFDAASNRVFSFNGDAHTATVIEPKEGTLIANVALGGKPEYGAAAGDGKVYVNLTDTSEVVEIDAKTAAVTRRDVARSSG